MSLHCDAGENGRAYDPVLGRMLQVDNYIQNPFSSQSYNRYSYVLNNPLKYVDPTGELVQDGEYEVTHDKDGNENKIKISNLGDDVGIDFIHHLDGDRSGQTEIVNTNNGFSNWIKDSRFLRGFEQRDNTVDWDVIYQDWLAGTGPENSLFFGRDNTMISELRVSNSFGSARNEYLKLKAWDFDNLISSRTIPMTFGFSGVLLAGTNMTLQMMGSAEARFYDIGDNQRITMVTDSKTKESYYYGLPWIKNVPRYNSLNKQRKKSTTRQTYIWIDNNIEP